MWMRYSSRKVSDLMALRYPCHVGIRSYAKTGLFQFGFRFFIKPAIEDGNRKNFATGRNNQLTFDGEFRYTYDDEGMAK